MQLSAGQTCQYGHNAMGGTECRPPLAQFVGKGEAFCRPPPPHRIILRKTASHFCWKCSLFPVALSYAKPLRTFAGNAHALRAIT
ncbi:hypothetical protein FIC94_15190 [Ochrobactrum teleogrylli]|uniref:Uncharacterized protein n=1 Tax=Ochrobactrum teleogrylli TaxID=2479765 RepID=A0ABY2Y4I2_9HYPH|nr:hypothetical protein FIC94_15190 [[Ochrobactrum] teleogrylli]